MLAQFFETRCIIGTGEYKFLGVLIICYTGPTLMRGWNMAADWLRPVSTGPDRVDCLTLESS